MAVVFESPVWTKETALPHFQNGWKWRDILKWPAQGFESNRRVEFRWVTVKDG